MSGYARLKVRGLLTKSNRKKFLQRPMKATKRTATSQQVGSLRTEFHSPPLLTSIDSLDQITRRATQMQTGRVSGIRSRDKALEYILPKFLGILWEKGRPGALPGSVKATLGQDVELDAAPFGADAPTSRDPITKVFSAHLTPDASFVDPHYFRYQGGRCAILSWSRGSWEDQIAAADAVARPIESLKSGLARS
jgi:hypothetical protein